MRMATKVAKVVTYCEGVPHIKSQDHFDNMVLENHVTN